jgi:hypothetical protein
VTTEAEAFRPKDQQTATSGRSSSAASVSTSIDLRPGVWIRETDETDETDEHVLHHHPHLLVVPLLRCAMTTSKTRPSTVRWVKHAIAVGLLGIICNLGLTIALLLKVLSEDGCWLMGCWIARVSFLVAIVIESSKLTTMTP